MRFIWFCMLNLTVISMLVASQSFYQFGSYEYYWSTEKDDFVRNYSMAEARCRHMNATMAIINTREIGEFFDRVIEEIPCELMKYHNWNNTM